jgi:hypothetical protein
MEKKDKALFIIPKNNTYRCVNVQKELRIREAWRMGYALLKIK